MMVPFVEIGPGLEGSVWADDDAISLKLLAA
jgi:hypothetical protein